MNRTIGITRGQKDTAKRSGQITRPKMIDNTAIEVMSGVRNLIGAFFMRQVYSAFVLVGASTYA